MDATAKNLVRLLGHTEQQQGCWVWTRARDRDGYGRASLAGQSVGAHRAVYELVVGPVPKGFHLHHHCETKACTNPSHLAPISPTDHNRLRVVWRTHCKHGHELTSENTREWNGRRICRKCDARRQREYQARKKAA